MHFGLAGVMTKRNPFKLLWEMFPAYVTALGTRSSAASIPVTRRQMTVIGVDEDIADFTTPLFSAIHMPGNAISVGIIAFSLAAIAGIEGLLGRYFWVNLYVRHYYGGRTRNSGWSDFGSDGLYKPILVLVKH